MLFIFQDGTPPISFSFSLLSIAVCLIGTLQAEGDLNLLIYRSNGKEKDGQEKKEDEASLLDSVLSSAQSGQFSGNSDLWLMCTFPDATSRLLSPLLYKPHSICMYIRVCVCVSFFSRDEWKLQLEAWRDVAKRLPLSQREKEITRREQQVGDSIH